MMPGMTERTHSYVRHGTTSLFAAVDVAENATSTTEPPSFSIFLNRSTRKVPDGLDVHIIMDNYATHKTSAIKPGWRVSCIVTCIHANIDVMGQSGRSLVR
jgi:hypothetical protein